MLATAATAFEATIWDEGLFGIGVIVPSDHSAQRLGQLIGKHIAAEMTGG